MNSKIPVLLRASESYARARLKEEIDLIALQLGGRKDYSGSKIFLKPNLISARAPALACTSKEFIGAVAEWFIDCGARVSIGDSPAFGSAVSVMGKHGILEEVRRLGLEIVAFHTPRLQLLSHGVKIGIAEEALECDLFVNMPRIKAHNQMFVTMAVKNLFGIVVGMRKAIAHMKNGYSHLKFADLMLDLIDLTPPGFTLVDGIEVMHKQGPVRGESLAFNCLGGAQDPLALDTALLQALELEPSACPIWQAAQNRGKAGSDTDNHIYPFLVPESFHGSGFRAPSLLNPVPFNPFRFAFNSLRRAAGAVALSRG